jgi:diacylglycerol kinase family enzyme
MPLDLDAALGAIAGGEVRPVDIATANGRPFVHQFSVGIHAKLVKLRDSLSYRGRLGKMAASVRAFWTAIAKAPTFHLDVVTPHGVERRRTAGISVSNNPLEGALPHAERLDAGVLGIYIIAPLTLPIVLRLGLAALAGRWKSLPEIVDREAREVTIRFPRRKRSSSAAIDGELVALDSTVALRIHPGALKVVLPKATTAAGPDEAGGALAPA